MMNNALYTRRAVNRSRDLPGARCAVAVTGCASVPRLYTTLTSFLVTNARSETYRAYGTDRSIDQVQRQIVTSYISAPYVASVCVCVCVCVCV